MTATPVFVRVGDGNEVQIGTISNSHDMDQLLRATAVEIKNHLRQHISAPRDRAAKVERNRDQ